MKTVLSRGLALLVLAGLMVGCSKQEPKPTQSTQPATSSTAAPAEPENKPISVEYDHCGLHLKLDETYAVGLEEENKNCFTFDNGQLSGTVTFGKLAEIGNGAKTSKEYALLLMEQNKDLSPWEGTSTGFAYYVVSTRDDTLTAEALYIHGEYAWVVKAQGKGKQSAETLIQVVGRCGLNAEEIPVQ